MGELTNKVEVRVTESINSSVQRLEQDVIVTMFEIDATSVGGELVRFSPGLVDGAAVKFRGHTFIPLPIKADGFEWNGKGTLPRPSLTTTAQDMAFLAMVLAGGDLVGAPVRRIRTYRKHLDDGAEPDPGATMPVDHYVVERKTSQKKDHIQFELSVQMDKEGRLIPARQVIRDTCGHRYRTRSGSGYTYENATCPYEGPGEWGVDGSHAPGADKCGKRLSDCKLRFGPDRGLPFYGFPGVGRTG